MKSTYEAVVVGAGPSGCSTAIHLGKMGVEVLLLDKSTFPRDKVCGDGVPRKCFPLLEELGIGGQLLLSRGYPIRQLNIHTPSGEVISYGNLEDEISQQSVCLARRDFDFLIVSQAKKFLPQVALGMEVVRIEQMSKDAHIVLIEERETGRQKQISTRILIGADGANSIVSRQKEMVSPRKPDRFIGLRAYWDNGSFEPVAHIVYDHLTLPGYVWLFPISKNRANIGMVVTQDSKRRAGSNMVSLFKDIVSSHHIFKGLQKNGEIFDRIKASPLNLGSARGHRVKDGVILVGDAACLINPLTGGGIFNAMFSGKQAAYASARCLRKNDVSQRGLKIYEKSLRRTLSASFFYSSFMKRCLQKEKTAYWWLQCCGKNRVFADIFLSFYGNPLPRLAALNPLSLLKALTAK